VLKGGIPLGGVGFTKEATEALLAKAIAFALGQVGFPAEYRLFLFTMAATSALSSFGFPEVRSGSIAAFG